MSQITFNLIEELGLQGLSEEEKKKFQEDYANLLEDKISTRIMDELSDEKVVQLESLINSGKTEEVNKYIVDNVPNIDIIAREEFEGLKKIFIDANQSLMADIEKLKNEASDSQKNLNSNI